MIYVLLYCIDLILKFVVIVSVIISLVQGHIILLLVDNLIVSGEKKPKGQFDPWAF